MIWETEDGVQEKVCTKEEMTFKKWNESEEIAFLDCGTLYVKKRDVESGDWNVEEIEID